MAEEKPLNVLGTFLSSVEVNSEPGRPGDRVLDLCCAPGLGLGEPPGGDQTPLAVSRNRCVCGRKWLAATFSSWQSEMWSPKIDIVLVQAASGHLGLREVNRTSIRKIGLPLSPFWWFSASPISCPSKVSSFWRRRLCIYIYMSLSAKCGSSTRC